MIRLLQGVMMGFLGFALTAHAETLASRVKNVTCFDISDPGANGEPFFIVAITRKSENPRELEFNFFDVTVRKQISNGPPHAYQTIGTYTVTSRESPETEQPYYLQFATGYVRPFELGLFRTGSLPWADLRMVTNNDSIPSEEISMQLECTSENL